MTQRSTEKSSKLKFELRLAGDALLAEYVPPPESIRVYVTRLVSHSRSIGNAKVDDGTPLDQLGPGIALQVMQRFYLPHLVFEYPYTLGELIRTAERCDEGIKATERESYWHYPLPG